MNYSEADKAFTCCLPVYHDGIKYKFITAITKTRDEREKTVISATMKSMIANSSTTARIEQISLAPPSMPK